MRSYEPLLGDKDYTEEQIVDALSYIYTNFPGTYGSLPKSPSSIVEHALNVTKYMNCSNPIVIEFAHNAFQPGAVHILPQNINKKMEYETLEITKELREEVNSLVEEKLDKALRIKDKQEKYS